MQDKIYMFLGLARKANALIIGEESVEKAIRNKKVKLVIIASDASSNTKKKMIDKCNYYNVVYRVFGQKELIGKYIGKNITAVVGTNNQGFLAKLIDIIDVLKNEIGGGVIGKG